jgi:hypothetical protein
MQLRMARLCLDCEEVHDDYQCPVCASHQFTYLTRWVPVPERRDQPRPVVQPAPALATYQELEKAEEPRRGRTFSRTLVGLGAAGVLGLFLGSRRTKSQPAADAEPNSGPDPA